MNTFFLIVLGQIISLFGNAALRFALPLYLLRQTGSAALRSEEHTSELQSRI